MYYYPTTGQEPDIDATQLCNVRKDGIHIGSASCKECPFCEDYNDFHLWIICSKINEAINGSNTMVHEQITGL